MEMASLRKYAQINGSKIKDDQGRMVLFFTPSEELSGGSLFSRVSSNFKIIHPYLEKIDSDFISIMNRRIQNINSFVDLFKRCNISCDNTDLVEKGPQTCYENQDSSMEVIHMYQPDIYGLNAIDYAFQKNAIFCIKAFVESLMLLPDEVQFRNCFDRALLMMIQRNINVN